MFDLIKFELKRIKSSPLSYVVLALPLLIGIVSGAAGVFYQSSAMNLFTVDMISKESLARMSTWTALTGFYSVFPIMGALYVTLFVGNDMSSGFLRNKMIAGHKRSDIFFSYVITQTAVALVEVVICISAALIVLAVNRVQLDFAGGMMFVRLLVPVFAYISMIFLYTAFTLCVRRRALPIVLCAVFAFSLSTAGFIASFGNYSSSDLNKYLSISDRAKADINLYLKDNAPAQKDHPVVSEDPEDAEEFEYVDSIDFYYDQLLTPNKPFYYVARVFYLVTDAGLSTDYKMSLLDTSYNEELQTALATYVNMEDNVLMSFTDITDLSSKINGYRGELKEINVTVDYMTLDAVYNIKTLLWSCVWLAGGFLVFRRKNIF